MEAMSCLLTLVSMPHPSRLLILLVTSIRRSISPNGADDSAPIWHAMEFLDKVEDATGEDSITCLNHQTASWSPNAFLPDEHKIQVSGDDNLHSNEAAIEPELIISTSGNKSMKDFPNLSHECRRFFPNSSINRAKELETKLSDAGFSPSYRLLQEVKFESRQRSELTVRDYHYDLDKVIRTARPDDRCIKSFLKQGDHSRPVAGIRDHLIEADMVHPSDVWRALP
ncbi:hypothetical protein CDL15_Pgr010945 [Punica granatum]|uniref:Uncharacterized protein n=1 Tax=Punica granatum TaxID=22663 RepID=A0A218XNP8_PUNGR|nr:hypothetical protein CDL15_Pgr010945 [Punica granatum]